MSDTSTASVWQPPSLRVVNPVADKLSFEQELEQARERGYSEGMQKGLEAGRQQAQEVVAEMTALWDAMQQPFADMEHDVHSQLTGLAVAVAQAVLKRELKTDTDLIRDSLTTALDGLAGSRGEIEVVLNPDDADMVASLLDSQGLDNRLRPDPNLLPGGCRLVRGDSIVDASVEALIANVLATIAEESQLTDERGVETGAPLDPEQIAEIARRFAKPTVGAEGDGA